MPTVSASGLESSPRRLSPLSCKTGQFGTPDLAVEAADKLLLVEVKVGAPVDKRQLIAYRRFLQQHRSKHSCLSLLAIGPPVQGIPDGVETVRWFHLAKRLNRLATWKEVARHPLSRHLTLQLLDYLRSAGLAPERVRSTISREMRDWEKRHGKQLVLDEKVTVSLVMSELKSLWALLDLVRSTWLGLHPRANFRFGSGIARPPWIGWNVNAMTYFLWVPAHRPEMLTFELFEKANRRRWEADRNRAGFLVPSRRRWSWRRELDLVSPTVGFFLPSADQETILSDFISESLKIAARYQDKESQH